VCDGALKYHAFDQCVTSTEVVELLTAATHRRVLGHAIAARHGHFCAYTVEK
jgi:hypothetical protein